METNGPGSELEPAPARRRAQSWHLILVLVCGMALGWLGAMGCVATQKEADMRLISQAWGTIQRHYVDHSAAKPTDLTYGAISGMVNALGDTGHSTFLTPEMVKELKNIEKGHFKGIGIEVQMKDGKVVIVAPIDGSPAQQAGLKPGDIIVKVNEQDVKDWPLSRVVRHIAGRVGTKVTLTVQEPRSNQTRQVTVARATIQLHEVTWHQLPGTHIAHLRVATFDAGVTRDLRKALTGINQQDLSGIILDLRSNPGGLLDEAVGSASQFLNGGNVVLARNAKGKITPIPVQKGGLATSIPMVVLVNQGTASAAEIVAGALKDAHRAPLVGETTFGTGTVLQEFGLSDGSAMLLAVEEWLTPDGHSFWHKGITPQYVVKLPDDTTPLLPSAERDMTPSQLKASSDTQLLRAVELLSAPKARTAAAVQAQ